ncbi:BREX-1 system phosphatase PglZ type A [Senegalimassilia anaerobia]|uniref:BREX-1 system phosphatase PglZ type A n=1 Tax=Senegalimassilia anaerobia TaxID=1473216 RepID=UPI0026EEE7AF|nr:BREX-1 system phosphatase PglZ type A [Senegalimassilia anaerobia]
MDIDTHEIENRIKGQFSLGYAMLFWEDELGEYAEVIDSLELGEGAIIDATGAELACKRTILRGQKTARNLVVYRSGAKPCPQDDFLYDVKLAATPFTCKMEGIWASECGVPMVLAGTLAEHGSFFNSKERRGALAAGALDKNDERSLRLAMLAACAGSKAEVQRDAVRDVVKKLLVELGRGQSKTLRTICECGLAATLWSEVSEVVGYAAPAGENPTLEDLALRMLKSRCAELVCNSALLKADAARILADLARDSRTCDSYDALAREYSDAVASSVDAGKRTMESIGTNDTLPVFDDWIVADMLGRALDGMLSAADARNELNARLHTHWFEEYGCQYEALAAAAAVFEEIEAYRAECTAKTTEKDLFDAYCADWHRADEEYRRFVTAMRKVPAYFKRRADELASRVDDAYGKFLVDLTDRWQLRLMDAEVYPPTNILSQADFFYEKVEKEFPRAEDGKRLGVIISDALRYEVGADLATRIAGGTLTLGRARVGARCEGMVCMLPSYTQLGMAALLPRGAMTVDLATANVLKNGDATDGLANRQKVVEATIPGALLVTASKVLEEGLPCIEGAPLVMVYHNTIDKRGDSRDTEGDVFTACEDAIAQVARVAGELLRAGCGKVLVTADHGFLYQDQQVEDFNFATVDGLSDLAHAAGQDLSYGRRYAMGLTLPKDDILIEYSSAQLSLEGEGRFAFPRGITRLRLRGSGARYVHGGASLQENAIPLVTIERVGSRRTSGCTGVLGFLCGRPAITGSTVALDVYQTEPCSEKVTPLTVRVGLYDPDDASRLLCAEEQTLELASTAQSSEERKTRVALHVIDDVDDRAAAVLRISRRVGNTNQFEAEWEKRLSVNRAFGNDFDF